LQAGYRRKIGDCVRLIDSTSVKLSGNWATFPEGICGAKAPAPEHLSQELHQPPRV
jgi:hypothetical protein